jgi:recombination protein RecT
VRIAITCIRQNPELANCTPVSFLGALFTSAQIGLEPVAGKAYLLPFNNSRKTPDGFKTFKEVQFVIGYKGVAELFFRHSKSIALRWGIVKEKDDFDYCKGTEEFLRHKEARGDRGKTIGYWVLAQLQGGGKPFEFMAVEDCMAHGKKHSKTYNKKEGKFIPSSPWNTEPDSMCLKTVLLQLSKLLPLSTEIQRALEADESSREFRKEVADVLDIPSSTNWQEDITDASVVETVDVEAKEIDGGTLPIKKTEPEQKQEQPKADPSKATALEIFEQELEQVKKTEGTKTAIDLWWARNEADIKGTLSQMERNAIRTACVKAKRDLPE